MRIIEFVGYVGSVLLATTFIPQIVLINRLRESNQVSILFLSLNIAGTLCMLVYGLCENITPVIANNALTLCLLVVLMVLCMHYKRRPPTSIASKNVVRATTA